MGFQCGVGIWVVLSETPPHSSYFWNATVFNVPESANGAPGK